MSGRALVIRHVKIGQFEPCIVSYAPESGLVLAPHTNYALPRPRILGIERLAAEHCTKPLSLPPLQSLRDAESYRARES